MIRHPLRFTNDEDRRTYRRWMRVLALSYGTILLLAIVSSATWLRSKETIATAVTPPPALSTTLLTRDARFSRSYDGD